MKPRAQWAHHTKYFIIACFAQLVFQKNTRERGKKTRIVPQRDRAKPYSGVIWRSFNFWNLIHFDGHAWHCSHSLPGNRKFRFSRSQFEQKRIYANALNTHMSASLNRIVKCCVWAKQGKIESVGLPVPSSPMMNTWINRNFHKSILLLLLLLNVELFFTSKFIYFSFSIEISLFVLDKKN